MRGRARGEGVVLCMKRKSVVSAFPEQGRPVLSETGCVCVRAKERERESERESVKEKASVCVCVSERERYLY